MAANTTAKTATPRKRAARKVVAPDVYVAPTGIADGFVSNGQGPTLEKLTPRKRASRSKAVRGVTLDRNTPKRSTARHMDYSGFVRALWNMGDAAETATGGNAYYARKRDELISTFVQYL